MSGSSLKVHKKVEKPATWESHWLGGQEVLVAPVESHGAGRLIFELHICESQTLENT